MKKTKEILLKIVRIKALKYIIVAIVGVVVVGFMDENSVLSHLQNEERIGELKQEIARYRKDHERDEAKLKALDSDRKAVERVAREKYFMKKAGEDIFVLSTDRKNKQ